MSESIDCFFRIRDRHNIRVSYKSEKDKTSLRIGKLIGERPLFRFRWLFNKEGRISFISLDKNRDDFQSPVLETYEINPDAWNSKSARIYDFPPEIFSLNGWVSRSTNDTIHNNALFQGHRTALAVLIYLQENLVRDVIDTTHVYSPLLDLQHNQGAMDLIRKAGEINPEIIREDKDTVRIEYKTMTPEKLARFRDKVLTTNR